MTDFTVTPPKKAVLITLKEDSDGQVDIIATNPQGISCRLGAFANGKLHLFRQTKAEMEILGIEQDSLGYPLINRVDM